MRNSSAPHSIFGLMRVFKYLGSPNQSSGYPNELLTRVILASHREHLSKYLSVSELQSSRNAFQPEVTSKFVSIVQYPFTTSTLASWLSDLVHFEVRGHFRLSSEMLNLKSRLQPSSDNSWSFSNTQLYLRHSRLHGHAPGVPQKEAGFAVVQRMDIRAVFGRCGLESSPCHIREMFRAELENNLYFI